MERRYSKRITVSCALALSVYWLGACGGRYRTFQTVEDDGSVTVGGSGGGGGRTGASAGAGAGRGGSGSAGSGHAGTGANSGSAGACGKNVCPVPNCAAGFVAVQPQGQCCPVCQPDPAACLKGQQSYAMDLEPLASKVSFGCASNAECVVVSTSNKCQACGAAPVWYGLVDYFTSSTEFSADQYCKTCDAAGPLPCVPPGNAVCDNGQCIFAQ